MDLLHRWWSHPADYAWTAAYHKANPLLRHAGAALGTWCWLYAVLCVLALLTPVGVQDGLAQILTVVFACTSTVIGACWMRGRWPTERVSRLFVAYLDITAAGALLMLHEPFVALPFATAFAVCGGYVAGLHSPKMMVGHQAWAAAIIAILFIRACLEPGADIVLACAYLVLLTLVLFSAPMVTHILLLLLRRDSASAFYDPLTGLRNRRGLDTAITEQNDPSGTVIVMVIDLDDFKSVNDRHGHAHGDLVLQRTANAIYQHFPPPVITARTGGEEFAVVTRTGLSEAIDQAHQLQRRFGAQTSEEGSTVSIGIAQGSADVDELMACADAAMYAAKQAGGNAVRVHDAGIAPVDD